MIQLLLLLLVAPATAQFNKCDIELGNVMLFKLTAQHLMAEFGRNLTATLHTLSNDAYYLYYPSFVGGYGKDQITTLLTTIQFNQRFDAIPNIGDNAKPVYYITGCDPDTMKINGTVELNVLGSFNFTSSGGQWSLFLPGLEPNDKTIVYYYSLTLTFVNNLVTAKVVNYNLADLVGQYGVENCYYQQFFAPWSVAITRDYILNPRQEGTPFRWNFPEFNGC